MDGNVEELGASTNPIGIDIHESRSFMDVAMSPDGMPDTSITKDTKQASAQQVVENLNSTSSSSTLSESRYNTVSPLQSQIAHMDPDVSFPTIPGVLGEGQNSIVEVQRENTDLIPTASLPFRTEQALQNLDHSTFTSNTAMNIDLGNIDDNMHALVNIDAPKEEGSLFVPDEHNITPGQSLSRDRPEIKNLNNPNTMSFLEANNEAFSGPTASGVDYRPLQQLGNTVESWVPTTEPNQYSSHPPQLHGLEGLEQDYLTAPINEAESSRVLEMEVPAKSTKIKRSRAKTGPRAKSAREWFAKRSKDVQPSLPMIAGVKRKRSKKKHEDATSSPQKRRKSKKKAADKSEKKTRPNKKSIKVMEAMFESLRHSDPIEARIALGDLPQADPIIARTKVNQFQQIMKGLPKHVDEKSIKSDKKKLEKATRSFGYGNCVARDGKWLIRGMQTTLFNHQLVGVEWMLGREFCKEGPWGGILGDEMGMGKTLQALACIVSNRPSDDDLETYSKTTLIVAPATSIEQWKEEIRKHTDKKYIGTVLHFKQSQDLELETLHTFGIILASYHEVSSQFPSRKFRAELQNDSGFAEEWKEKFDDNLGPLFRIPFWRVILDEAHNIKNKDSQMSVACQNLSGRHRWGMSGTPITNSLDELYPYFKFLKSDWAGSISEFQYLYGNTADDESENRLGVVMNILMLRRTMSDRFMGRPLYEVPMCYISVEDVRLTKEERVIYNVVESRFVEILNAALRKHRKKGLRVRLRDLEIYIIFLLRLRQAVSHSFLLEPVFKKTLRECDLMEIKSRLEGLGGKNPLFQQIGKWYNKKATTLEHNVEDQDDDNPQRTFGSSQSGYKLNIDTQVNIAIASKKEDVCRLCYQEPIDGHIAECEHLFCKECLDDHINEERYQNGRVVPRCPDCNKALTNSEPLQQSDSEDSDVEGSVTRSSSRRPVLQVRKLGRDSFGQHPKFRKSHSRFLQECDQAYPEPVAPSAKTIAVMEAILKWLTEAPEDKIIVFMEFKMTGAILGRMLEAKGIGFVYFFGGATSVATQNAIRGFHEKKQIKVMIASFRRGSVALNLTCANRVILVDLWWNIAIEMQAFARVFRIGQTKETHFLRIVADNTIDNRIEALQEEKIKNISKALESGKRNNLTTEEIAALFGHLKTFDDGSFEILPEKKGDAVLDEELEVIEDVGEI
ncbi:SNF2 family N-terminal domain-containing protein [Xylaria curta]|nr:SNF2 family N-terminal domain-containing protein [Xylaria curta]